MSHQGGDGSTDPRWASGLRHRSSLRLGRTASVPCRVLYHSDVRAATAYGEGMSEGITARRFHESEGVEDWRVVGEGACTYFRTGSFEAEARLVSAISELAGLDDHHPDVDLRPAGRIGRPIRVR